MTLPAMKVVRRIWAGTSGAERLLLAAALLGVLSTCIVAGVALFKRPGDISNPNAAFKVGKLENDPTKQASPGKGRSVNWPRFGYDPARTKFLGVQHVKPPFTKVWKYDQDELIEFPPIVVDNRLYMIDNDGIFITLDKGTGKVVWKKQLASLNASSPAYWHGMLLAVTLDPAQALGVRASDGKVMWKRPLPSRAESSPLVIGDRMYFGSESGAFYCFDAKTGKPIWETDLGGSVKAAPAYADGTIYVGDYSGTMNAMRADNGEIRWQTGDLGSGLGSGRFYSTPAVAFGRVYAGNVDGRVYSFDRQTGEIAWTFSAGDYVYSGVAAADGDRIKPSVYFGSHDRNAYALNAETGELIWKAQPGGQVSGPATVVGDVAYFSTFSGNSTVGFDLGTGRRVFKVDIGEYGPVVSDGVDLFVLGGSEVIDYQPIDIGDFDYKTKPGEKGIVPPKQRRKAAQQARKGGGEAASSGDSGEQPEQPADQAPAQKKPAAGNGGPSASTGKTGGKDGGAGGGGKKQPASKTQARKRSGGGDKQPAGKKSSGGSGGAANKPAGSGAGSGQGSEKSGGGSGRPGNAKSGSGNGGGKKSGAGKGRD
jgi:outer membrane protein assembly factor BamB